jgi:subtilisin family serine protease
LAALNCFTAGIAFTAQAPVDIPPHVPGELIVRFRAGARESDRSLARATVRGNRLKALRIVDGLEVIKLPAGLPVEAAIEQLRQNRDVLYAEPNFIVRTTATPNDQRFGELWGLLNFGQLGGTPGADIEATRAWDLSTGSSNVVVAVIDTGTDYNHGDLAANMFRNSTDCNQNGLDDDGNGHIDDCFGIDTYNGDSNPMDDHNHGTHVAGTIGAVGNNALGVVGVNWNVRLLACKFLGSQGSGTTSGAIACLEYVKLMKDRGANIVATNNSWGGGGFSQALYDAIDAHRQRGILFIAAAGNASNNNDEWVFYPAGFELPNIIAVAATDRFDQLAYFSNFGRTTVHLGAPGHEILSTTTTPAYSTFSGTSMATPHVAGVAALLKAQDPDRDWRAIKNLILAGGDDNAALAHTITGKRLNAFGALSCAGAPVFSRMKPKSTVVTGAVGVPVPMAALNIDCAAPNGSVEIAVSPTGERIALLDDGLHRDQAAGDGVYSGQFIPADFGTFNLSFPDGEVVTVLVPPPHLSVSPAEISFGSVIVGTARTGSFTVQNIGGGILSGTASTSPPFSIVEGASYELGPGDSRTVTVRFSPLSVGSFSATVSFTGGGGASRPVTGAGVICPSTSLTFGETKSGMLTAADCDALNGPGRFTDLYTFAGKAGQPIKILLQSADFYTYVKLRDPDGTTVAWSDSCPWGGRDSCIPSPGYGDGNYYLLKSGAYTIEATSYFAGATGAYAISLNPKPFTLTVNSAGTGTGYISLSGVYCGTSCTREYAPGTWLTLVASPESGSAFAGWSGACSGAGVCNLTMTGAKTVTANFIRPLQVGSAAPPKGEAGVRYDFDLPVTGGLPPYNVTLIGGALPPGLGLGSPKITGTPAQAASASFTVQITDRLGASVTKSYRMKILAPLEITTAELKPGTGGKTYKGRLRASGGEKSSHNWTLAGGSLPAGLTLSSSGTISGVPAEKGTFNATFQVTDSTGGSAQRALVLTIN